MPLEILSLSARATGRSVEAVIAALDVEPVPVEPAPPRPLRQRERARMRATAKAKRNEERAARLARARAERERRTREESARRGCPEFKPKDLPPAVWSIAGRVIGGSRGAERELARFPKAFARAVERGALGMEPTADGYRRPTRTLRCIAARRVVAVAAILLYLSDEARRGGYALTVEGYSRGSLCSAFRNPNTEKPISLGLLFATQVDSRRRGRWDCGAVVALHRAGAVERLQPPASTQHACNVGLGRDGRTPRALNQYFVRVIALMQTSDASAMLDATADAFWLKWSRGRALAPPSAD